MLAPAWTGWLPKAITSGENANAVAAIGITQEQYDAAKKEVHAHGLQLHGFLQAAVQEGITADRWPSWFEFEYLAALEAAATQP